MTGSSTVVVLVELVVDRAVHLIFVAQHLLGVLRRDQLIAHLIVQPSQAELGGGVVFPGSVDPDVGADGGQ